MNIQGKAEKIELLSARSIPMRTFHITWFTFFLCFFAWFGIAPLMAVVRQELSLTKAQVGNIIIASVSATFFARLFIGWLCDRIGPRLSYTFLLIFGSIPVICIGFSNSYESFLLFRLAIGVIGASFVITQYHTSVMFAPKIVGTANATVAGWGNLGGGVTQMVMPLIFAAFVGFGYTEAMSWRYAMVIPGVLLLVMAAVYYFFTKDTPAGNFSDGIEKTAKAAGSKEGTSFLDVCKDYRVWVLFLVYGACFGVEICIDNIAAMYFTDVFHLSITEAGVIAGCFGLMNLFARALGGYFSDLVNGKFGFRGRVLLLAFFLGMEGLGIALFSQATALGLAIVLMIAFALFVKMSNGATYSVVPFINKKALGLVSGIVGAGGNAGGVLFGFIFKSENISYSEGLMVMGVVVISISLISLLINAKGQEVAAGESSLAPAINLPLGEEQPVRISK